MSLQLASSETGEGEPLLIVHGLFGSKRNWSAISKALGRTYRVITLDLRNHGDSPHAPEMSYEVMADDLATFIEAGNMGPVSLLGHSMGGKASMVLAMTRPELLKRLLVLDIAPIPYDRDYDDYIDTLKGMDFNAVKSRADVDVILQTTFADPAIRSFLLQNLKAGDVDGYNWRVNLDAIEAHMGDIMGFPDFDTDQAYEGTTLFLGGQNSDYITFAHQAEIERLFPNSDLDFIEDAGHWVHADQPHALISRLKDFLET